MLLGDLLQRRERRGAGVGEQHVQATAPGADRVVQPVQVGQVGDVTHHRGGARRADASYGARALQEPTARQVAAAFLNGSVRATTRPGCPAGCLGVQGALAVGDPGSDARDALIAWRNEHTSLLRDRFRQAVDEGDLPPDADPELLARYLMTVANGIAVQAAGGTARDDLQQVADMALRSWPPA
ncbi:TetR family transcriptional regulator C-terminal domain-containing protein [Streptomyces mirabilis]|uniref:TetR family transcriptional regulator C-terminal domain-containing protein n=1 Tax=Streptomyces mirabilis TaxID=68239 RepID=UPI0036C95178